MLLFSPVQLEGAHSIHAETVFTFPTAYPWSPELARMLECSGGAPFDSISMTWGLLDPRAFELMGDEFLLGRLDDVLGRVDSAALRISGDASSTFAFLAVSVESVEAGKLVPASPPARDYWQRSAAAWLRDALEREGVGCTGAMVGWPVPLRSARIQLVKGALQAMLKILPLEMRAQFLAGEIGWEPGSVLLRPDPSSADGLTLSSVALAVPAFGLKQDYASYAVAQTLEVLRAPAMKNS